MAKYIIQKAVAPAKVIKPNRLTLAQYGERFIAQHKYDGCCAVVNTTHATVFSRTGETCLSMQEQAEEVSRHHGSGLVLIAEAWWPGKDQFSEISGAFRKKSEQRPRLKLVVHDILTDYEFGAGYSDVGYKLRMSRATPVAGENWFYAKGYAPGTYGCPQELCDKLAEQGGYDGLVLKDPNGTWTVGEGTTGEIVKIKRELSFDLRVTEVNTAIGDKTGRTVYKLVVDFKGKPLGVGSGVPHNLADVPKVGDIVEVKAMDYSSDGLLREPRYKGIRHDKLEPDN